MSQFPELSRQSGERGTPATISHDRADALGLAAEHLAAPHIYVPGR
jgi:hypothetical protein